MIISAPRLFLDGAFSGPGAVEVADGRILRVLAGAGVNADVALETGFLAPGLIDLHNNGAFGVDFATGAPEDIADCVARLATRGVTSVLPTIITAPWAQLAASARRIGEGMAAAPGILGVHLEGPFLAAQKRGAHRVDWLALPEAEALDRLFGDERLMAVLRVVTLAPELANAAAAIRRLTEAGVAVSLGHTAADPGQMREAAAAGARMVTHVFTAQGPVVHRGPDAPGVPVIALMDARLWPCVIVDGVHVEAALLSLVFAACPRAIAVTDSVLVAGRDAGTAGHFGGGAVVMGADGAARRPDGTLAGAGITLDEGVRRLIAAGVAPATAFAAATQRPADALGLADRGRLTPGARADLVWWSDDFHVRQVWRAGQTPGAAAIPRGTEAARPDLMDFDTRPTADIVLAFLARERAAQWALAAAAGTLAALADAIAARMAAGGRLFYAGAGTSGRLGLLDAVECGPTFSVPDGVIIPVLAGGADAFLHAIEGAEDNGHAARTALAGRNFGPGDALVGIAASGATPFTLAALGYAREIGALTGAIVNNAGGPIAEAADIAVVIDSGPEIIAGSTRLSAGTVQKIALNTLSSTIMIRLGKTFGPYMVDLRATNEKLRRRAVRMVMTLAAVDEPSARAALAAADFRVKTAIVMLRNGLDPPAADAVLARANGSLRRAEKAGRVT
jgi:N-acetylmuramic acid 6-phosphate etherase/N-acetylglucosamine-6-phosphate deacetylase